MSIVHRLRSTGKQEQLWHVMAGLGKAITICCATLIVLVAIEAILHGTITARTVMWFGWLGVSAFSTLLLLTQPLLRWLGLLATDSVERLALRVGEAYPDVRDTLSNALQLSSATVGSPQLSAAALQQATLVAEPKDFSVIINKRPTRRWLFWAALTLTVVLTLPTVLPDTLGAALERLRNYSVSYMPPAPFRLSITVSSNTVMRGTDVAATIRCTGVQPKDVVLYVREGQAKQFTPFPVVFDTAGVYEHQFPGLASNVTLYAYAPWNEVGVSSDTISVTVIDRPLIRALSGRVVPPAYAGQPPVELTEQQADVTALRGSTVLLQVTSNKSLAGATIVLERNTDTTASDTVRIPMDVKGAVATGSFTVQANGTYHVLLQDADGQTNAEPLRYGIVALRDGHPTIAMVQPKQDVDVDASGRLPILVAIADDYGFSSLRLRYKLVKSRYAAPDKDYHTLELPLQPGSTALEVGYTWDMTTADITPEDVFEFYVEVADNDVVTGPKLARTSVYRARMPSLDEVFAEADRTQESLVKDLKDLAKETEQLRREADELQRELQKQQSKPQAQTQWSDRKKAEDLAKRQEELQKRMEETADKLEKMTEKLQQNQAISEETLQKYKQLQELMREVKSAELEKMRRQMQEAMKQISPEELERMMQNFKFDEEKFKQNIERTINLLKRIQAEQKADELAKRAEELARKQEELRKQAENTNAANNEAREKLAQQQSQLKEELSKLAKESKELEQLMKELGANMPMEQMQSAMEELDAQQTESEMQDAQQQMQKGDMQEASKKQQQASKNLQRFAQQMQQVKKQMNKNAQREAARQMQRGMQDMLELSREQEALMQQMKDVDPSSQQFTQMAQRQKQLQESMKNMANSMMQLSQRSMSVTPEMAQDMGDALQQMQNAIQQMQDRNGNQAQRSQQGAMSSMNSAAQRMSDALSQMMSGEGSGQGGEGQNPGQGEGAGQSPFQRLQQLADQQQQINQQMGNMGQQPGAQGQGAGANGGQLSQEQRAELGRLAAQQGRALKALEELERESRNIAGSKKPVGDLNQIAEDMKEVMTDMQTGSITPETRLRQERILSRLLNASRSMNERDYEKTRESQSGTDVSRPSPPASGTQLDDPAAMRGLMDQLRKGYTRDYENLIRMYFEELQKQRIQTSGR